MKEWMFPTSYNYLQAEASHLIHHADSNQVQFYIRYFNYLNPSGVQYSLVNFRNRKEEERRLQTLCDKHDSNNLFEITFHQTSLSFKQFFL